MRQGLEPNFDFTAQYVLTVDDLFLHYASTSALVLEVNRSWGAECQLVARTDAPLRELLQGRRGKVQKFAQLYAVGGESGRGKDPQVVGSLSSTRRYTSLHVAAGGRLALIHTSLHVVT